jgi:hypothetical protein
MLTFPFVGGTAGMVVATFLSEEQRFSRKKDSRAKLVGGALGMALGAGLASRLPDLPAGLGSHHINTPILGAEMHPHTLGAKCAHPSHFKGLGAQTAGDLQYQRWYESPVVIVTGLLVAAFLFMPR